MNITRCIIPVYMTIMVMDSFTRIGSNCMFNDGLILYEQHFVNTRSQTTIESPNLLGSLHVKVAISTIIMHTGVPPNNIHNSTLLNIIQ